MKALEAKVVVLGSQGVGKTSLIQNYLSRLKSKQSKEVTPTIGASFFVCKLRVDNVKIKMQVWDTAGQERFRAMAPMYYRNANAALLVFDIANYNSFLDIKKWVQELQKNVQEPLVLTLVGNKNDLSEKRSVSREEAFLFAASIAGSYFETSTVLDRGVDQIFYTTAMGLSRMSSNTLCSSLKRYESYESLSTLSMSNSMESLDAVQLGISVDENNLEATDTGRLETPSWSIDHIAHGETQQAGWCCSVA